MKINFTPTDYKLQSVASGNIFNDRGWLLDPPGESKPSLIRALYKNKQLQLKGQEFGLYTFADWMPVGRMLKGSSAPVTYKSIGLAKALSLENLYITFSGYWPEKGATMPTCSAGNTARAFAQVCSDNEIPLLLCVPEANLDVLWFEKPLHSCVKLLATEKGSDYFDAIHLSNQIIGLEGFYAEGGAKNVARRDGMGTTVLSATTFIGRIPDYYFQAIGSGTGAIAAWEANLRFIEDGRFGSHKMKLMVSQNHPFIPIKKAWEAHSREMLHYDHQEARCHFDEIDAKVLSNRKPPYPIKGGLFDALSDTGGMVFSATNHEARDANLLFQEIEGVDLHPAAAIATASLIKAVEQGLVEKDAVIMLNITGGGEALFKASHQLHYLKPEAILPTEASITEIEQAVAKLNW
jgi:cysteate synthase